MTRRDKLIEKLITKMLEKYGVGFDYIMEHRFFDGVEWFRHYTFTQQEHDEFKEWAINEIQKTLKVKRILAEKEYLWFDLMWGLMVV